MVKLDFFLTFEVAKLDFFDLSTEHEIVSFCGIHPRTLDSRANKRFLFDKVAIIPKM